MGTTIILGYIFNGKIFIGHVGDSRAYLIRNEEIHQITEDHSYVNELLKLAKFQKRKEKKSISVIIPNYNYERFSRKIPYPNLKIRKMTTRWGVCNVISHNITLNLELMKRDISYLDYVIIHELCHFYEANHSARFWKHVSKYYPKYKEARKELREV